MTPAPAAQGQAASSTSSTYGSTATVSELSSFPITVLTLFLEYQQYTKNDLIANYYYNHRDYNHDYKLAGKLYHEALVDTFK